MATGKRLQKLVQVSSTVKPVYNGRSQKDQKLVFKTNRLMQIKSIAEHSAILSNCIKLPFVIKIFVLSIFEWPFYTSFTEESVWYSFGHNICSVVPL